MRIMKKYALVSVFLLAATTVLDANQEYWPQWRGPNHNGSSQAVDLPTAWSLEKNVVHNRPSTRG